MKLPIISIYHLDFVHCIFFWMASSHLLYKILLQSYLSTHWFQNSSNSVLIEFRQENNVSALRTCSELAVPERTCFESWRCPAGENASPLVACSILIGLGTRHEFQNELTSTEVPLCFELGLLRIQIQLKFIFNTLKNCSW